MRALSYAVVEAPSILGLKPSGVEKLSSTLLRHGLAERICARRAGRLETPPYKARREPGTLTLNGRAIASWSRKLADVVGALIDDHQFPVILGGDCSIVLGPLLALKRRGRYGLLFIDGHADFYQPEVNPNGEAASMELAFATGHGPELLSNIEGRGPLVRNEDAFVFAFRDGEEQKRYGSQPLPRNLRALDLEAVRRKGVAASAASAVRHLTRRGMKGFFIHVDADCLDDDIMPAVDYRMSGGLSWDELETTLDVALASDKAVGMEITIYNPKLDKRGVAGRRLTDLLVEALRKRAATLGAPR